MNLKDMLNEPFDEVRGSTELCVFDVLERTEVEVELTSAVSAWILRHPVWFLNRYQQHTGGTTSF